MIRAGTGNKQASLRECPHRHCINTLITFNTLFLLPAVFNKSRRIEDNGIKLFANVPQVMLHVVTDEPAFVCTKPIESDVLPRKGNGGLGTVDTCHLLRPSPKGIDRKSS